MYAIARMFIGDMPCNHRIVLRLHPHPPAGAQAGDAEALDGEHCAGEDEDAADPLDGGEPFVQKKE